MKLKLFSCIVLAATTVLAQQPQQPPTPPRDPAEGGQATATKSTSAPTPAAAAAPQAPSTLDTKPLRWRSVGPANMGGRIADLAVNEKDPYTIFVAVGTGGVLRTTNNGTKWEPVFD